MNTLNDLKDRFPGLSNGWARFDGPAGTQVVDTAIEAMSEWQRSVTMQTVMGSFLLQMHVMLWLNKQVTPWVNFLALILKA